jgi:hypothetical protein
MFKGVLGSIVQLIVTNLVSKPHHDSSEEEEEEESSQYESSRE